MKEAEIGKKRNIAVVGHHGSGKTSLIEALLFSPRTDRLGGSRTGNTGDYLTRKDRKHAITRRSSSRYNDHVIN